MIIVRNKISNKLEEVYAGWAEYFESPDYHYHVDDMLYEKKDKYLHELTFEELNRARNNRII